MRSDRADRIHRSRNALLRDLRHATLFALACTASFLDDTGWLIPADRFAHEVSIWMRGCFTTAAAGLLCLSIGMALLPVAGIARWCGLGLLLVLATVVTGLVCRTVGPTWSTDMTTPVGLLPGVSFFWQFTFCLCLLALAQRETAHRRLAAQEALHATEMQALIQQSELNRADLGLLEAQIEPHFLFNSLANARRLLRTDASAARAMIGDLLRYFEESLPRLREPSSTLDSEAELVRAFLNVHKVRMGERLRFDLDIPPDLRRNQVPSMMLLTLVENALKHGLQPIAEGGSIRVSAQARDGRLAITVSDDGRGMGDGIGSGMGLANLRLRLQAMYGTSGGLSLHMNEPRGVVATVHMPEVHA
jgi:signal transduction histidine kinase